MGISSNFSPTFLPLLPHFPQPGSLFVEGAAALQVTSRLVLDTAPSRIPSLIQAQLLLCPFYARMCARMFVYGLLGCTQHCRQKMAPL